MIYFSAPPTINHKSAVQKTPARALPIEVISTRPLTEGWYCVSEEIFYTEKEIIDGKSPTGKEVQRISEKNYFSKCPNTKITSSLTFKNNLEFIQPESRRNEVLGFLKKRFNDLYQSSEESLELGIEILSIATTSPMSGLTLYSTTQRALVCDRKRQTSVQKW
ncbi:MAG: hypothetical protein IPK68_15115 [Bdellovibrionales bacterium]|nr:hypothetical protein [Bdellovibrionales bacterium]